MLGNDGLSVENVYLKGYASPEDTYPYNTRLSANRVRSIRNYLQENFGLDSAVFITATEPEDWDSLRRWVVLSDLPARNEVLAVIDTVSDPDPLDPLHGQRLDPSLVERHVAAVRGGELPESPGAGTKDIRQQSAAILPAELLRRPVLFIHGLRVARRPRHDH